MTRHLGIQTLTGGSDSDFFRKLCAHKNPKQLTPTKRDRLPVILALDPGHTTGIAILQGPRLLNYGQLNTTKLTSQSLTDLEALFQRSFQLAGELHSHLAVVIEDYRIYSWKSEEHEWSDVYVARLIGFIMSVCVRMNIEPTFRLAQNAKGFVTDEKLKRLGWYVAGWQHSRDAIRHVVYHALFDEAYINKLKRLSGTTEGR